MSAKMSVGRVSIFEAFWTLTRYGLVGVINTIVGFGSMALLAMAGLHYAIYSTVGYFLAFVSSYLLNARYTFRTGSVSFRRFNAFLTVNLGLLAATHVLQYWLIDVLGAREVLGILAGAVFYTGIGYIANGRIVYRPASPA